MHIMIAGGGIGGLTAALCLHEAGVRVSVFESGSGLKELGVGINVLPHAVKEYERLGLDRQLLESGVELQRYAWFNKFGQPIWSEPRGRSAGYNWPQISIHRGRFQRILSDAVRQRLGAGAQHWNHHLKAFEQVGDRVRATFVDRRSGAPAGTCEADALIGADGIHSAVRAHYYPDEGPPRWSGNMLWRMTVEIDPVLGGQAMIAVGNARRKIVGYEISREAKERGKSLFNWIAEARLGEPGSAPPQREDWNRKAASRRFSRTSGTGRSIGWMSPISRAGHRRCGCSPWLTVTPSTAGPSDGSRCSGTPPTRCGPSAPTALPRRCWTAAAWRTGWRSMTIRARRCGRTRRSAVPATAAVVLANRANAHDEVLEIADRRAPDGFADIRDIATDEELENICARYRQTAQFDKKRLQEG